MSALRTADPAYQLWHSARARAAYQVVPFHLTLDDVRAAWPRDGCCPVYGTPLRRGRGFQNDSSPSLDRLNGAWGYTADNVAIISLKANRAKGGLTTNELERIVTWMRGQGLA